MNFSLVGLRAPEKVFFFVKNLLNFDFFQNFT